MKKDTTINYICPECESEFTITVYPFIKGRLYGPPEDCYEDSGPDIDPDECDCGQKIDANSIYEKLDEAGYEREYED